MNRLYCVLALILIVVVGCGSDNNLSGPLNDVKTGTLIVNVVWPEKAGVAGKNAIRRAPDKIIAYLYRLGVEVTRKSFTQAGSYGTAELIVNALSGYRLEIVATYWTSPDALYIGLKDNITVAENAVTTVDITMSDVAPVLSAKTTGDASYIVSWTRVPLTDKYLLEESPSPEFLNNTEYNYRKLSTTVYSGPDSTKTFTGKQTGTYYYAVFAVTPYGSGYTSSYLEDYSFDFYDYVQYGAMSNIVPVTVQSGEQPGGTVTSTGTIKIKVPWPIK